MTKKEEKFYSFRASPILEKHLKLLCEEWGENRSKVIARAISNAVLQIEAHREWQRDWEQSKKK